MKKIVLPGLVAGIIILLVGIGIGYLLNPIFPQLTTEYENFLIFRPWDDPLMKLYFIYPFVLGIILAWIWNKSKKLFNKNGGCCGKGVQFGLIYWILTMPGMFITYSTFQVSLLMVTTWSISLFIHSTLVGMLFGKMNK